MSNLTSNNHRSEDIVIHPHILHRLHVLGISPDDGLLTTEQTARVLTLEVQALNNYRRRGQGLCFIKMGGNIRYHIEDISTFYKDSHIDPATRKEAL